MGREHDERRAVLESMDGAHGEERCSYRPQQHGCDVNGIRGEAGRSILLLEASSRMSKQARLSDVPAAGSCRRPDLSRSSQPKARACPFTSRKKIDNQLDVREISRINQTLQTTPTPRIYLQLCLPWIGNAKSTRPTQRPSTRFHSTSILATTTSPASTSAKCSAQSMDESWRKGRRRRR